MQEKPKILLVDDEERILRSLSMLLRTQYQIFATSDGHEALRILGQEKIHVIISDQRMPIMTGTELLSKAKEIAPDTIRILLTGYSDADAALDALNDGEIFRYINKPWGPKELRETIAQAANIAGKLEALPSEPLLQQVPILRAEIISNQGLVCLVLDRDENTYLVVKEILGNSHEVVWSQDVNSALSVLTSRSVAIMVTELSLGDVDLSTMIKTLKQEHPELLTIILTNFKDTARLVELINQAQVFRYLPKPVRKGLLGKSIESSIVRYRTLNAQPERLETQVVESIQDPLQKAESNKVADFLAQLRAKINRSLTAGL
ncbi:response regulator [Aquirhabdus parva]|uniref:Response regulator n=1 Tax=Aquirhabdus parva TaxID=2283318 RepID=A0A345P5H4_9GAMM|nr:response regulator [Aquirhabdus parva]AXI02533.1 response regulator [Aquirhabdus parva]